jgi:hypothetical protein
MEYCIATGRSIALLVRHWWTDPHFKSVFAFNLLCGLDKMVSSFTDGLPPGTFYGIS